MKPFGGFQYAIVNGLFVFFAPRYGHLENAFDICSCLKEQLNLSRWPQRVTKSPV